MSNAAHAKGIAGSCSKHWWMPVTFRRAWVRQCRTFSVMDLVWTSLSHRRYKTGSYHSCVHWSFSNRGVSRRRLGFCILITYRFIYIFWIISLQLVDIGERTVVVITLDSDWGSRIKHCDFRWQFAVQRGRRPLQSILDWYLSLLLCDSLSNKYLMLHLQGKIGNPQYLFHNSKNYQSWFRSHVLHQYTATGCDSQLGTYFILNWNHIFRYSKCKINQHIRCNVFLIMIKVGFGSKPNPGLRFITNRGPHFEAKTDLLKKACVFDISCQASTPPPISLWFFFLY